MITSDESDSDVNDPKECKVLDTIFDHAIAPGCGYFGEVGGVKQAIWPTASD